MPRGFGSTCIRKHAPEEVREASLGVKYVTLKEPAPLLGETTAPEWTLCPLVPRGEVS